MWYQLAPFDSVIITCSNTFQNQASSDREREKERKTDRGTQEKEREKERDCTPLEISLICTWQFTL